MRIIDSVEPTRKLKFQWITYFDVRKIAEQKSSEMVSKNYKQMNDHSKGEQYHS